MMFKKSLAASCAAAAALGTLGATTALADPPPLPTVGGKIFADLTNIDMSNNGTKTAASGTGVDVKRFYLVFGEKFDDIWSANITTDATYNSVTASTCTITGPTTTCTTGTTAQQVDVYIKKAYLQYSLPGSKAFFARLGSADLPWLPFVEDLYGYRYVENVLVDRLKFGTSADWGLHGGGQLDNAFSYAVSVVNGNGYKNPTRSKSMDVEGRLAFMPFNGLTLAIGGYSGKLGQDKYGSATGTFHTAERVDAVVAYINNGLRLGAEYFGAHDWNQVTKAPSDKSDGYSAWASFDFTTMFGVFGRWDQAKLSKDLVPGLKDEYFNVGLATHPRKGVDLALVFKHEKMDGGLSSKASFSTSNGSFNQVNGTYNEVGLWAQVAF